MWFFMITCYVMSLVSILMLLLAFFQSIFYFDIFAANHLTFMVLTSIVYFFTETLVIFFFVGTGVSVKEYTQAHNLPHSFHKKSIGIKRIVYPPLLLNMLFMIILFCLVGAVDTHRFPAWGYQLIFAGCIFDYLRIKKIQNTCFRENTKNILEMSGLPSKI